MERRVLIAVALSFVVLYGYQAFFVPAPQPGQGTPPAAALQSSTEQGNQIEPSTTAPSTPDPETLETEVAVTVDPAPLVSESLEREIRVDTATVEAIFSNRGARLLHWRLKDYQDADGASVDLVPAGLPEGAATPFVLRVDDAAISRRLDRALYRVSGANAQGRVDASQSAATLTFDYEDADGLKVRKSFRFEQEGYVLGFSASVAHGDDVLNPSVEWGAGLGDIGATPGGGGFFRRDQTQPPQAIYHENGSVERVTIANVEENPRHDGEFRFVGIDDHYFLAVAVAPGRAQVEYTPVLLPGVGEQQRQLLAHTIAFSDPPQNVRFFFGPKQFDLLRSVDAELVRAINFGFFSLLTVPLLGALTSIYGVVGNYGLSIIILTILINLVIFPLRHKSVVSMRKMQMLQPQLKAIQDRYAGLKVTDPSRQKMNTEIMNLYREKGVNPASGCVPMLLTMPVLFAFYSLLSQAIELRGASFGLWIHDLSQHDPYYVTPVLMGLSMFYQQRITPTTADPAQQRIMMMMPLMFGFMFLWAPSGLVIYWFVSNLWAIGQQHFTNWWIGPAPVMAVRPPAERRLKSAGTGKTPDAGKGN